MSDASDDNDGSSLGEAHYESSLRVTSATMTAEERRLKRKQKRLQQEDSTKKRTDRAKNDEPFLALMAKNEDVLLKFVARVNKIYEQKLKKNAPFMTFVFCGMQSAGKSTIMERFMNAVLNIIQEGTGTRCPLDTTCIHDDNCKEAVCDLTGDELGDGGGEGLSVDNVFELIIGHNKFLAAQDRFSTSPLRLVYRANNVQNMRFVDTPGIISNKSTGKDNREDIKRILTSELRKPNTKLCVLLEPKEFATNPIIEFCDSSLGGRDKWIPNATFLMTKFDKQLKDSRTASKANGFFREFHNNGCYPHLVIMPTLPKEDLKPDKLFEERRKLLAEADSYEREHFDDWLNGQELFRQELEETEVLSDKTLTRLRFASAKKVMREIMLQDTAKRLPEVLASLRKELDKSEKEQKRLRDMQKFHDPRELKSVVGLMLSEVDDRMKRYLDGDLESSMKFPQRMQTLDEEIDDEEFSEWSSRELNFYTEREDFWRDRITELEEYPEEIQSDMKFLGGKQYQRAIGFFRAVMIDALPDPFQLKELVPNVTGYLSGGLQRENWERATVEIVRVCLKDVSHPGINYLVKHVGNIFRRLFRIALDDIKQGEEFSSTFKLLPRGVEKFLNDRFDEVLWDLMKNAADKTHCALEPMYSTVDPSLPTFYPSDLADKESIKERWERIGSDEDGQEKFKPVPSSSDQYKESWIERLGNRLTTLVAGSGQQAKAFLKEENRQRAKSKRFFLPDERTAMITEEETQKILQRSFEYIVGLMDFNLINLRFQLNHYLLVEFKTKMKRSFFSLTSDANWDKLVEPDPDVAHRLEELKDQIASLKESLQEVQRMNRQFL